MRAQRDHVPTTVPKNRERSNRWSGPISNTLLTGSREYVAEPRSFAPGAAPFEHRTRQRSQAIHSGRREEGDDRVYHKAQISDLAAGLAPAFMTARGEDESVMETARDTARDTARGSETDYMSTAEPDTYRSTSTFSKVRSMTLTTDGMITWPPLSLRLTQRWRSSSGQCADPNHTMQQCREILLLVSIAAETRR